MSGKLARRGPLLLILLTAAATRFYRLAGQSLWADEGNSVALAHRTFAEIARRTAFDIHPPLYYWLLKIWVALFGDSEIGLRSLSAVLGVGLVYLIWWLGRRFFGRRVGLPAALLAAVSPFQVYYAQEARMYMLLTLLGLLSIAAAGQWITLPPGKSRYTKSLVAGLYIAAATAGLYTHYAFPLILLTANGGALLWLWNQKQGRLWKIRGWLGLQLLPLLLYLPWLPIAWRQLTTWPAEPQTAALPAILATIATTLAAGLAWPFQGEAFITAGLALTLLPSILATRTAYRRNPTLQPLLVMLWLWFLLPVLLTVLIFSPAFLKFLLVAAPPLTLLVALAVDYLLTNPDPNQRYTDSSSPEAAQSDKFAMRTFANSHICKGVTSGALLLLWLGLSAAGLWTYYTNPQFARDNYRGIVNFIKAVGRPADAVILNAEGQQDVFNYYYHRPPRLSAPVYPLPQQRPLDEAATINSLAQITAEAEKIYAVYWATQQADPAGLIEGWLDEHLFKATDRWYGNVRLVSYANLRQGEPINQQPLEARLGESIRLTGAGLVNSTIAAGDILLVGLTWQTGAPLPDDYTVFLQLLDPANHLVGQRDAAPLTPTSAWSVGQAITDRHGLFVEPGTPPGPHRLIAGLYHSQTGQRLPVEGGENFVALGTVEIIRPEVPLPREAFDIQNPETVGLGNINLLGYDLYKLGHRSTPDTPLQPGDPLHLTLYWQATQTISNVENKLRLEIESANGEASGIGVDTTPAGVDYPASAWQPGEIVRGQFDMFLSGLAPGDYRVVIKRGDEQALTRPFSVNSEESSTKKILFADSLIRLNR